MTTKERPHSNIDFRRWVKLIRVTGQIERVNLSHETLLDRGFFVFIGFLLGLMVAWCLR